MIAHVDPATGGLVRRYALFPEAEIERRLSLAWSAFERHRATSFRRRAELLLRAAELLEADREALGLLMSAEMGKPITQAVGEIEKCARVCRYYAEHGETFLADEPVDSGAESAFIRYQPLGPVLAVMPWNFPFWQVFRFAAPALMAGNVGLLKHASNVPGCALAIEELLLRAGYPEGTFQSLLVDTEAVAGILDDPRVRAATLTGSNTAGSAVAERAGRNVKKTVLELGGSDPFIVMPSADLAEASRTAAHARTINAGQSCIAAKRFIVHDEVYDEFERSFVEAMRSFRVGDPRDPATEIGPLATESIRDEVHAQVRRSVEMGAELLLGGVPLEGPGFFYPPTVLARIPSGSPAATEEIFGPVAALFRVNSAEEALRIANDSRFGLSSSVWTVDGSERDLFVAGLEVGQVFVNAMSASDPRLPFGGVKDSGYGRELGLPGIREFVNTKTVSIGTSGPPPSRERRDPAPE